jgi:hypothetical protein
MTCTRFLEQVEYARNLRELDKLHDEDEESEDGNVDFKSLEEQQFYSQLQEIRAKHMEYKSILVGERRALLKPLCNVIEDILSGDLDDNVVRRNNRLLVLLLTYVHVSAAALLK